MFRLKPTWRTGCLVFPSARIRATNPRLFSSAMFQQRLNSVTGQCEWVVVSAVDEQGDGDEAVHKCSSESLYLDMLNDYHRNRCFDTAISRLVERHPSCFHVLDIGTGTGLLSLMAYRAMQRLRGDKTPVRVTSCESYLPMYKVAKKVLRENKVESGVIHLLHMRSDEIKVGVDMPSRADALVCEILDSELLGEGVIPSLRHAHEHLLKPNAPTVPYRATVYAQLVECEYLWRCHDLQGVESELKDGLNLAPANYSSFFKRCQYVVHADALPGLKKLSEPFEAFSLDFHKPPNGQVQLNRIVKPNRRGTAHAIVSWWSLQLDEEALINYSTAPHWIQHGTDRCWSDHWKQCVWFLPGRGVRVEEGQSIDIMVNHDDTSVWYSVVGVMQHSYLTSARLKISPERTRMLGDSSRRDVMQTAIDTVMGKEKVSNVLVLDDSLPSAVFALSSLRESQHVLAKFPGIKRDGLNYLTSLRGLKLDNFTLVQKELKQLSLDDFNGEKIDVVLAEPYYATYECMLPWKQLRFWYEKTVLKPLLSNDPVIVPSEGILYGMAYSLPDLWNSRCSLDNVEGFPHNSANKLVGACGNLPDGMESPILPFSVWQCGKQESLSEPFQLLTFRFHDEYQSLDGSVELHFSKPGVCHGFVVWMDWVMDSEKKAVLSTRVLEGPSEWKQGVKLLSTPVCVTEARQELRLDVSFDGESGDVSIKVNS